MTFPYTTDEQVVTGPTQVPHSREAEEAAVGACLINPEAYFEISAFLVADDFYIHRNKYIWEAFISLHSQRIQIDLLTVSNELERMGKLGDVGGPAYVTSLINQVPSSLNAESYGRIVEGLSIRRKMITSANRIATLAYNQSIDTQQAYAEGRRAYDGAYTETGTFETSKQLASELYDRMDARANGKDQNILPTGFIDLDRMMDGGMRGGELITVGGRPGMGKTGFILDIAKYSAVTLKKNVAIFSLEMSNEQVIQRMVVKEGIAMEALRTGNLEESEWPILTHAIEVVSDTQIFMDDMPAIMPAQLRSRAHQLVNNHGLDLLIVDYLQLMGVDSKHENRVQEVSYISRSLKVLARELNIPVMVAAQLNRSLEQRQDKRPIQSDLRESGSIEQDSDVIFFLYRDEMYDKDTDKAGIAELIVSKQRDGKTGTVELLFRGALMKFENLTKRTY